RAPPIGSANPWCPASSGTATTSSASTRGRRQGADPPSSQRHTRRQTDHRKITALLQDAVEEVPGCQAVGRLRFQQEAGKPAQRLGRADQEAAGGHPPAFLARRDPERDWLVLLEVDLPADTADLVNLNIQLDVLAQLLDDDSVALQGLAHLREGGGQQISVGPSNLVGRLRRTRVDDLIRRRLASVDALAALQ